MNVQMKKDWIFISFISGSSAS